ncbi:MAG: hypothetical protein ACM3S1_01980 [Hyphomicrobiales bacterium]
MFQGLWCAADREGRLVDDPARLKVEILPYDKVSVDRLLQSLHEAGFIVRYESGGRRYIQVVNFARHQSPHVREPASTIPAPGEHRAGTRPAPVEHRESLADPVADPDPDPDPDPVAVADPGPPAEDPVPLLLRHWERATGTTVTPAFADWLDAELGEGTPLEWLRDAISETGANGSKAWKYTRAIIERWRVQGRTPPEGGRHGRERDNGRRAEEACRATGQPHDWPNLPGWCERCTSRSPSPRTCSDGAASSWSDNASCARCERPLPFDDLG